MTGIEELTLLVVSYGHATHMFSNGDRCGPLATALVSASKRAELTLWVITTAKRVVRTGGHATGVEIECSRNADGHAGVVSVTPGTGRVILSAGAFGSAKLLFRSTHRLITMFLNMPS